MGDQDHWSRKMITYFKRHDFNHDGVLTKDDFEGMANRFTERLDTEKGKTMTTMMLTLSDAFFGIVGGPSASQEVFVASVRKYIKEDPSVKANFEAVLALAFQAIDANDDGIISQKEYRIYFDILGIKGTTNADAAFAAIDTNKDGKLSKEEFVSAGSNFFFHQGEEHPSDIFYGPLV